MTRMSVVIIIVGSLLCPVGCAGTPRVGAGPTDEPGRTENTAILTLLFMGLSSGDGQGVSEQQWEAFLHEVVTPRFPSGLTVLHGHGQYLRSHDQKLGREQMKLLLLVHPGNADSSASVNDVIAQYKIEFGQESILRVDARTHVQF